jgi:hypothetical protein
VISLGEQLWKHSRNGSTATQRTNLGCSFGFIKTTCQGQGFQSLKGGAAEEKVTAVPGKSNKSKVPTIDGAKDIKVRRKLRWEQAQERKQSWGVSKRKQKYYFS